MWSGTPLFPEQASTMASRVDNLYFFLLGLTVFFSLLIAGLIVAYAIKFRRRSPDSIGAVIHGGLMLEITWPVIPLIITMVLFVWAGGCCCVGRERVLRDVEAARGNDERVRRRQAVDVEIPASRRPA